MHDRRLCCVGSVAHSLQLGTFIQGNMLDSIKSFGSNRVLSYVHVCMLRMYRQNVELIRMIRARIVGAMSLTVL